MAKYIYTGSVQSKTIGAGGTYKITAYGAAGGSTSSAGGAGGEIGGSFALSAGEKLEIVVGGEGTSGGGGGGTFVLGKPQGASSYSLLLVAGGGGGAGVGPFAPTGGPGGASVRGSGDGGGGGSSVAGVSYVNGGGGGGAGVKNPGDPGAPYGSGGGFGGGDGVGAYAGGGGGVAVGIFGGNDTGGNGGFGGGGGSGSSDVTGGGGGGGGGGYSGGSGGNASISIGLAGNGGTSFDAGTTFIFKSGVDGGNGMVTIEAVCFASGSRILTARGNIAVEALSVGDLAITASGARRPIKWLGHRTVDCGIGRCPDDTHPVRIAAHTFGTNLPARDLYLSPGHPVLVGADEDGNGGHLVPIMCLVNGTTVRRVAVDAVTYWHVELDAHDILLAEGLPAESYIDLGSRPWFDGADGILHDPDLVLAGQPGRCRPVAIDGPVVEAERRRLDAVFATRLHAECSWPSAQGDFFP